MIRLFHRANEVRRDAGLLEVFNRGIRLAYRNLIRAQLPTIRHLEYNGVRIDRTIKPGDSLLPSDHGWYLHTFDRPNYESGLVEALARSCLPGDEVVIVGGGWGVTAVWAAKQVGERGAVVVYEASGQQVEHVQNSAALNEVEDRIEVRHAVVGSAISLKGQRWDGSRLHPTDLPDCDVLQLDCEGAEVAILRGMAIEPRSIIVETHGQYGAPTHLVRGLLEERGYEIRREQVAETGRTEFCERNDVFVLSAVRGGLPTD